MSLHLVSDVLIGFGVFWAVLGSVGILRLPDFYTRSHAAAKPDTLGLILVTFGLALRAGLTIDAGKLILVGLLVAVANPAASHALGRAAVRRGLAPWMRERS